jgi:hypothetical protein
MGTNRNLFRQTGLQKSGRVKSCALEEGFWVEYLKNFNIPESKLKECSTLVGFSTNKNCIQIVCQRSRTLDAFLYEAAENVEVFFNIQDQNL